MKSRLDFFTFLSLFVLPSSFLFLFLFFWLLKLLSRFPCLQNHSPIPFTLLYPRVAFTVGSCEANPQSDATGMFPSIEVDGEGTKRMHAIISFFLGGGALFYMSSPPSCFGHFAEDLHPFIDEKF